MDLVESEFIVIATLLDEWPEEMPPCLGELILRAPNGFNREHPNGKAVALLRELHYQKKPTHLQAFHDACLKKGVIKAGENKWWSRVCQGGLHILQAELEAKTLLETWSGEEFRTACLEIGQRVTDDPENIRVARKLMAGLLSSYDKSALSLNGNGHPAFIDYNPSLFLNYEEPQGNQLLLPAYLTQGDLTVLAGAGGTGKSRLALQLAVSQILSWLWCGLTTAGGPKTWQFFGSENSPVRIKTDLSRFWPDLTPEERALLDKHLWIEVPLASQFLSLDDGPSIKLIQDGLAKRKPDAVVYDPFINYLLGDIKSPSDVRATTSELIRITHAIVPKAAIFIVHHARAGRVNALSGADIFDAANFGLGAKALFNCSRCFMNLIPGSSEDRNKLVLACAKASNCQHFETRGIMFDESRGLYVLDPEWNLSSWKDDVEGKTTGKTCPIIQVVNAVRKGHRSTAAIVEFLDHCSKRSVERSLSEALEKQYLEKIGHGQWLLGKKSNGTA